jgi:hypothetical protein
MKRQYPNEHMRNNSFQKEKAQMGQSSLISAVEWVTSRSLELTPVSLMRSLVGLPSNDWTLLVHPTSYYSRIAEVMFLHFSKRRKHRWGKAHKANHFYVFIVANPVTMLDNALAILRGGKTSSLNYFGRIINLSFNSLFISWIDIYID